MKFTAAFTGRVSLPPVLLRDTPVVAEEEVLAI
jgi:hypothetical protein